MGEGFSGIYSPSTGALEARLSGDVPGALVVRNGGHSAINRESFGGADDTVAFAAVITEDGLEVTWRSMGINFRHFDELEAPVEYRRAILDLLTSITGLRARG